jgi:ABC-2 type transport system permease protein
MGYGAFLVMEGLILWVYKLESGQRVVRKLTERNGLEFETYYSSLSITFTIMLLSMFILGSIFFALVAGDIVAKENEDGNLRLVFSRPISRLRLLLVKYTAICLYTFTFVFFVGISGYAMAVAAVGWEGGLLVMERGGDRPEHDHAVVDRVLFLVFPDQAGGGDDHHADDPVCGHDPAEFPVFPAV